MYALDSQLFVAECSLLTVEGLETVLRNPFEYQTHCTILYMTLTRVLELAFIAFEPDHLRLTVKRVHNLLVAQYKPEMWRMSNNILLAHPAALPINSIFSALLNQASCIWFSCQSRCHLTTTVPRIFPHKLLFVTKSFREQANRLQLEPSPAPSTAGGRERVRCEQ